MLIIKYTVEGFPVSDFEAEEIVESYVEKYNYKKKSNPNLLWKIKTSSELFVLLVTEKLFDKELNFEDVEFYCEDEKLVFTKYGLEMPKTEKLGYIADQLKMIWELGTKRIIERK